MASLQQTQQKRLLHLLKRNAGCSLFKHLEIHNLHHISDFEELHREFIKKVPVFDYRSFRDFLENMLGDEGRTDIELLSQPQLIQAGNPSSYVMQQGHAFPFLPEMAKAFSGLEKEMVEAGLGRSVKGRVFHIYETSEIKTVSQKQVSTWGALMREMRSWPWHKNFLPDMGKLREAGRSQYQVMHAFIDELEQAEDVEVLISRPSVLTEISLLLAQREGRFVPLKELCPSLKLFIHYGEPLTLHRKELNYFFNGMDDLRFQEAYIHPAGIFAYQDDANLRGALKLRDDMGVFYEFIPAEDVDANGHISADSQRLSVSQLEKGRVYAVLVSSESGFLALNCGDIFEVVSLDPLRIKRRYTVRRLNHFDENLTTEAVENLLHELNDALIREGFFVRQYTVGDDLEAGYARWILEISRPITEVDDNLLQSLANRLHTELELQSKTYREAFKIKAAPPEIIFVSMGTFSSLPASIERRHFDFSETAEIVRKVIDLGWQTKSFHAQRTT